MDNKSTCRNRLVLRTDFVLHSDKKTIATSWVESNPFKETVVSPIIARSGRPLENDERRTAIEEVLDVDGGSQTSIRRLSREANYPYSSIQRTLKGTLHIYP